MSHTSRLLRRFHEVVSAYGEGICASDSGGSLKFRELEESARRPGKIRPEKAGGLANIAAAAIETQGEAEVSSDAYFRTQ